jgi:eukaryotic-like serine/threonine-protein kinase
MKRLGKYEVHETVGAGAMSTVYRGKDADTGETVAVKVLHPHLASGANLARFEREAQALSTLHHPNIIAIRGFSKTDAGEWYTALEFVEGQSMAQLMSREREMEPDLAAMVVLELSKAISVAHVKGIVHRDLKPENILIHKDGFLKILDFGLAYLWEGTDLTMPGTIVGSPAYMSPEQIRGDKPSPKMDLFSLGILFYLLLTGELPFKGKSRRETFELILNSAPPAPHELLKHVPPALSDLCLSMLGKGESPRLTNADEVILRIETYLESIGLGPYEAILKKYLTDPKGNRDEVKRELLNGYLRKGKKLVDRGERDRVFDLFRRVLAVTGVSSASSTGSDELNPTQLVSTGSMMRLWLLLCFLALVLAAIAFYLQRIGFDF